MNKNDYNEIDVNSGNERERCFERQNDACNKSSAPKSRSLVNITLCLCAGVIIGAIVTLIGVGSAIGGLGRLEVVRNMGEYDTTLFSELLAKIDALHFGETPTTDELITAAAHSMVNAVGDSYAAYYTKEEYESYYSDMNGNYSGIGVSIYTPNEEGAVIHRVYEGTFAYDAGVKRNDVIISVDGVTVSGISSEELSELISGEKGSICTLIVKRGAATLEIPVTRGDIYIKRVEYMLLRDNIGYIYINSFTGNAASEFSAAIDELISQGAVSLIIDLRNNPGGSLNTVIEMCDIMLPQCTIASMRGNTTEPTEFYDSDANMYDLPFTALVNGNSASASEIFAGAMQDNERAVIIGTQTFGKGVVQTTFSLDDDHGYIKLTTDAYFTPSGTNLNGTGITPDIVVDLPEALQYYDIFTLYSDFMEEDTQIQAAIAYLLELE